MGVGMAKNLQKHLKASSAPSLIFFNRTAGRGDDLKAIGGQEAGSVKELVEKCDIVFSCISNDKAVTDLGNDLVSAGVKGKLIVDCSTIHPDTTVKVAQEVTGAGGEFIAAPVFGASPVAEAGRLIFVMAGPEAAIEKIKPYVQDVMGRSIIQMGSDVSKSSMLKIAGNICVISFMEVISEAHVFAEKVGLGSQVLEDMIGDNFGPTLMSYSKRLTTGAYAPKP